MPAPRRSRLATPLLRLCNHMVSGQRMTGSLNPKCLLVPASYTITIAIYMFYVVCNSFARVQDEYRRLMVVRQTRVESLVSQGVPKVGCL